MLSHNNPTTATVHAVQSKYKFEWYYDGVGFDTGTTNYSWRARNIWPNLKKFAGFTAGVLGLMSNLPSINASYTQEYRVDGTDLRFTAYNLPFNGTDLGGPLIDMLNNGSCKVTPVDLPGKESYPMCLGVAPDNWLFVTYPVKPTTCDGLYYVSKCIAELALEYSNQTSRIYPASAPTSTPTPSLIPVPPIDDPSSLEFGGYLGVAAGSVIGLASLGLFGRQIYRRYFADQEEIAEQRTSLRK